MALALIAQENDDADGKRWFSIDIGENRHFRVAAGGTGTVSQAGYTLLDNPSWISPLQGPLAPEQMGRTRFGIPEAVFGREANQRSEFVQMMSYRTEDLRGPAVSPIIRSRRFVGVAPEVALSKPLSARRTFARATGYREAMPQAMVIGELLSSIVAALPQVGEVVRAVLPPSTGGQAPAAGGGGDALLVRLAAPETIAMLQQLFRQILGSAPTAPRPAAAATQGLTRSFALGRRGRYSKAQALPIAALAPLLGQVMTPQTVQAVLEAPNRHTQTIINGLTDVIKLALTANQQQLEHLRALNPGVDDPALDGLLASMSLALSGEEPGVRYRRLERVRLKLKGVHSISILGETRVLYKHGARLAMEVEVELPKLASGGEPTLAPALLELKVKDAEDLTCKIVKRFPLGKVTGSGLLPVRAELDANETANLEPNRDYLMTVTLVWKNRAGETIGNLITQRVTLMGGTVFGGIEDQGGAVDLADPIRYRDWWHRVHAGRFEAESKRLEGELIYTLALAKPGQSGNARIDARIETRPKERSAMTLQARVRSGLDVSLPELAQLAGELGATTPPDDETLVALTAESFRERLSLAVRIAFSIKGRSGESFAFWAYPAVKRASLRLLTAQSINDLGNVTSLGETRHSFVLPVALTLLATATRGAGQDASDGGSDGPEQGTLREIDGQTVIGRYKASFYPVRLVAESVS